MMSIKQGGNKKKKPLTTITLITPSVTVKINGRKYPLCKFYYEKHGEFAFVFDVRGIEEKDWMYFSKMRGEFIFYFLEEDITKRKLEVK